MGSWKTEAELAPGQMSGGLPELLRELAQALESGAGITAGGGVLAGLPVRDWRKLVLVAERRESGLAVKLKAKRAGEVRVPTPARPAPKAKAEPALKGRPGGQDQAGRDKYRQLKKGLAADFKALQAAAREGGLPEPEVLESFLARAELMGQIPQPVGGAALAEVARGNTAFLNDCQALRQAGHARNAAALAEVLERLARRKSTCHAQFR